MVSGSQLRCEKSQCLGINGDYDLYLRNSFISQQVCEYEIALLWFNKKSTNKNTNQNRNYNDTIGAP